MGGPIPKQYLSLCGKPILQHTLERLLADARIEKLIVAIAPNDTHWPFVEKNLAQQERLMTVVGGSQRHLSVLNALSVLSDMASDDDWVLVHDAVRPCLLSTDVDALIHQLSDHAVGGLLGYPVRDTLKRVDRDGILIETLDRENIWHAQTPQMFRYRLLIKALQHIVQTGEAVTDEAGALELLGLHPKIIPGSPSNIKITHPEDLVWAEYGNNLTKNLI